ncbi:hypothetical protein V8C42DRAFT_363288 [Trichoderma barbatum]
MSSLAEPFMPRGTFIPRIIRDVGACISCRRSGKRCDWNVDKCFTCQEDGLVCVQPINAYFNESEFEPPPATNNSRKRRRTSTQSDEISEVETVPELGSEQGPSADSDAETEILTGFGPQFGTQRRLQSVVERALEELAYWVSRRHGFQQHQLEQRQQETYNDDEELRRMDSVYHREQLRRIFQSQQRRLQQTVGYVRGPVFDISDPTVDPAIDPDHDYAAYYDYQYDLDSDGTLLSNAGRERKRSHTPYTLESTSRTSTVYQVKDTWIGKGEPPLAFRLKDFFDYMRECHLSHAPSSALPMCLLPSNDYAASEMLRYYYNRPTNRRAGPLPDINPINPKLADLAYSNPLVLQLIIAQRANHREVSSAMLPTGENADRFYAAAIAHFGPKIDSYLAGNEEDMLPLTLGSLILSLTERARLDKRGQAHNYPTAAKSILNMLITLPHAEICKNTPKMLLEYYMHTAVFACISADVSKAECLPFMSSKLQQAANALVCQSYVGKLCGTWFPILVLIQEVFQLGISMRAYADGPSGAPVPGPSTGYTPDHFATFGLLKEKIATCQLPEDRGLTNIEATALFRNAAMLYLWSLVEWPHAPKSSGSYTKLMIETYHDALLQLDRISEICSVNKALCWPLFIVGCFARKRESQARIEARLTNIANRFKVGNARESIFVLKHIWGLPREKRSPWMAHKSIRETKCWRGFSADYIPLLF